MISEYEIRDRIYYFAEKGITIDIVTYKSQLVVRKQLIVSNDVQLGNFRNERNIMVKIRERAKSCDKTRGSAEFIVMLQLARQTSPTDLHMLMTCGGVGNLQELLWTTPRRRFIEDQCRFYLSELLLALTFLHTDCRIIHRDIKPENVFIDSLGHLLLGDFEYAVELTDADLYVLGSVCTLEFSAPEMVSSVPYTFSADMFSFGLVAVELATGSARSETDCRTADTLRKAAAKGLYQQLPANISADFRNFIKALLPFDPDERMSATEAMHHSFFASVNWTEVRAK